MGRKKRDDLRQAEIFARHISLGERPRLVKPTLGEKRMVALYRDWSLMRELRLSYTELQRQPHEELEFFMAFIAGEQQAKVVQAAMG